jgi:hypothetical protein
VLADDKRVLVTATDDHGNQLVASMRAVGEHGNRLAVAPTPDAHDMLTFVLPGDYGSQFAAGMAPDGYCGNQTVLVLVGDVAVAEGDKHLVWCLAVKRVLDRRTMQMKQEQQLLAVVLVVADGVCESADSGMAQRPRGSE